MRQLQAFIFYLLVFLIPVHFFKVLDDSTGYVHGLLIDYLIIKVHILDCVAVTFIAISLWLHASLFKNLMMHLKKQLFFLTGAAFILIATIFFSGEPLVGLLQLLRGGMCFLVFFIAHQRGLLQSRMLGIALLALVSFQSVVAIYQYTFQQQIWGYMLLGEPAIQGYGITTGQVSGAELILPYGTTAHPNILAGTLSLSMLLLLYKQYVHKKNFYSMPLFVILPLLCGLAVLLLTQSISGIASFTLGTIALMLSSTKKGIQHISLRLFLLFLVGSSCIVAGGLYVAQFYTQDPSIVRRARLQEAALVLIRNRPIAGIGPGQFTAELENFAYSPEIVRFVQPVHMWLLLFLSEYGLLGVCLVLYSAHYYRTTRFSASLMLALIPLATLDHYLLSIENGLFLAGLLIATSVHDSSE